MKRTLIIIIAFCIGIAVGVSGTFLYQVWGRPTLPKVEKCKLDFWSEYDPPETFYPDIKGRITYVNFDQLMPDYQD